MDLNHLHLHVRNQAAAAAFYMRYLGFTEHARHGAAGEILFLRNRDGFDLALVEDPDPAAFPRWFHFGSRLIDAAAVRALHALMVTDGVPLPMALVDDPDFVCFRCVDPDGHPIEIYWE